MKYAIIEADGMFLAVRKRWFSWHEVCYKGYRSSISSAEQDIRMDKARRNPKMVKEVV